MKGVRAYPWPPGASTRATAATQTRGAGVRAGSVGPMSRRAWQPGQLVWAGFEGRQLPPTLEADLRAGRVGGVVLFARNFDRDDPDQPRRLCDRIVAAAPPDAPTVLAIDQEGGRVQRLRAPWTEFPPLRALGQLDHLATTAAVARAIARELLDLRITLDFAPVVDVDTNPANPVIGDRSFGREAEPVGRHAAAFIAALQAEGVAACAKHFPGHGDTELDSHLALPVLPHELERLRRVELPPFANAIAAGVATIMSAHVLFPRLDRERPATLSPDVLGLLRADLGFEGLVFSDDLEMRAIADHWRPAAIVEQGLAAGIDGFLVCSREDLRQELTARLEKQRDAAVEPGITRVVALKRRFGVSADEHGRLPLVRPSAPAPPPLAVGPGGLIAADAAVLAALPPPPGAPSPPPLPAIGPPYPEHQALAARVARGEPVDA